MWVVENDGDVLNGKRLYLPPGKKFVFGRTALKVDEASDSGQLFVVSDKTISRKHLTIEISAVGPDDCGNVRTRSRITLTDLDTKIGTLLNNVQIRGQSKVLEEDTSVVQLGKFRHLFRFTWIPVVLTFSFTSKEKKAKPYKDLYERLGPLDIKVLDEYKSNVTTHVVAKKRNTSKGLQALIDGNYIVHNDTFVNAILAATMASESGACPLSEDFNANWPDETKFLPPKGEEPTSRPNEAYKPSKDRQNMFKGYTFVFYDQKQFENLHPPISSGSGKALYRPVTANETQVDEFVRYVKSVAGEKGTNEFEDGSAGEGVVVVRYNPAPGATTDWFAEFGRQVALKLDQRLVEQNEFLDAILGIRASVLRRPLDFIASGIVAPPPTIASFQRRQVAQSVESPQAAPVSTPATEDMPPPTSMRARSRRVARTKFLGFLDDDFSGPSVVTSIPESMEVDPAPSPAAEAPESQGLFVTQNPESQGLFVTQDPEPQIYREVSHPPELPARTSRKRVASPVSEDEEDIMEAIAPGAQIMKKRRLAGELERKPNREVTPAPAPKEVVKPSTAKPLAKRAKKVKEATPDILEEARKRREEADALAAEERERLEAQFDDMDISEIQKKLVVEIMEVSRKNPPPRVVAHADESDRWDDKWNGRKNFKRFRRRGAEDTGRRVEKVIVALEEVKNRTYGIGDEFWDETSMQRQNKKGKGKGRETQESGSRPNSRAAPEVISEEDSESDHMPAMSQRRRSADSESSDSDLSLAPKAKPAPPLKVSLKTKPVRMTSVEPTSSVANTRKRPAPKEMVTKVPPAKKVKQSVIKPTRREEVDEDDDSDDDGLTFKFKKRK